MSTNNFRTMDIERVRELLSYDPETGIFRWKPRQGNTSGTNRFNARSLGKRAGSVHCTKKGYRAIEIDGEKYLEHRLAWAYVHGEWPENLIDHKNRMAGDNRIDNLQPSDPTSNNYNQKVRGEVEYRGVAKVVGKTSVKYVARFWDGTTNHYLGRFDTPEEAFKAWCERAKERANNFYPA